ASATDERLENATVVRLESDAAHGAGEPDLRQIAGAPLQRRHQWTTNDDVTDGGHLEAFALGAKGLLEQCRGSLFLRENRQGLGHEAMILQRIERLRGPRRILED